MIFLGLLHLIFIVLIVDSVIVNVGVVVNVGILVVIVIVVSSNAVVVDVHIHEEGEAPDDCAIVDSTTNRWGGDAVSSHPPLSQRQQPRPDTRSLLPQWRQCDDNVLVCVIAAAPMPCRGHDGGYQLIGGLWYGSPSTQNTSRGPAQVFPPKSVFGRETYFFEAQKNTQKTDRRQTKRGPFLTR